MVFSIALPNYRRLQLIFLGPYPQAYPQSALEYNFYPSCKYRCGYPHPQSSLAISTILEFIEKDWESTCQSVQSTPSRSWNPWSSRSGSGDRVKGGKKSKERREEATQRSLFLIHLVNKINTVKVQNEYSFDIFPTRCNITQFIYLRKTALHASCGISTHHQEHT